MPLSCMFMYAPTGICVNLLLQTGNITTADHLPCCRAQGCRRMCLVSRTGHARAAADSPLHSALTSAAVVTIVRCDAASRDEVACIIDACHEGAKRPPVQVLCK